MKLNHTNHAVFSFFNPLSTELTVRANPLSVRGIVFRQNDFPAKRPQLIGGITLLRQLYGFENFTMVIIGNHFQVPDEAIGRQKITRE